MARSAKPWVLLASLTACADRPLDLPGPAALARPDLGAPDSSSRDLAPPERAPPDLAARDLAQAPSPPDLRALDLSDGGGDDAAPCVGLTVSAVYRAPEVVGGQDSTTAIADFDGDGRIDVVATAGAQIALFHGRGDGTFDEPRLFPLDAGMTARELLGGDFDEDGLPDVLLLRINQSHIIETQVWRGRRDGTLSPLPAVDNQVRFDGQLLVGRVDGDAHLDVVVGIYSISSAATVLLGHGDGSFTAKPVTGMPPRSPIVLTDVDGDGRVDLVGTDETLLGDGNGGFPTLKQSPWNPKSWFGIDSWPSEIALVDLDGDHVRDLVLWVHGADLLVRHGNGDGTFSDGPPSLAADSHRVADLDGDGSGELFDVTPDVASLLRFANPAGRADLNGDGTPDWIASDFGGIGVLRSRGADFELLPSTGGWYVQGMVLADLDRDGRLDVAVGNAAGSGVTVRRGRSDGSFGPVESPPGAAPVQEPTGIAGGDFDGDGVIDILVPSSWADWTLVRSHDDGSFYSSFVASVPFFSQGNFAGSSAIVGVADLDGDGRLDVLGFGQSYTDHLFAEFDAIFGDGTGSFTKRAQPYFPDAALPLVLADVNGDRRADLIYETGAGVAVAVGAGDGTFAMPQMYPATTNPDVLRDWANLVAADLDGDGQLDLVVPGTLQVDVLLARGSGFAPSVGYATPGSANYPNGLSVADLDGDEQLDVIAGIDDGLVLWRGRGDGTLMPAVRFDGGPEFVRGPFGVGDLDGDGRPDVVVAGQQHNVITVFSNHIACR